MTLDALLTFKELEPRLAASERSPPPRDYARFGESVSA